MKNDDRFYVYCYAGPGADHPFYIGEGNGRRVFKHLTPGFLDRKTHFHNKLRKMLRGGIEPRIEFLYMAITEEEAIRIEISSISKWGRLDLGTGVLCNPIEGGDGLSGASPETRAKQSAAKLGKRRDPEAVAKSAASRRGKSVSPEVREKIASAQRGRGKSPEHVAKSAAGDEGKKSSPETRRKLSEIRRARISPRRTPPM